MKLKYKSIIASLVILGTIQFSPLNLGINTEKVHAASTSAIAAIGEESAERIIQQRATTDTKKIWTIKFNREIDFNSVKDSIQVNELNNGQLGTTIPVTVSQDTNKSLKINPPTEGYKKGQMYQVTIKKGARPRNGKDLQRNNVMKFSINGDNTAIGMVEISPVLSMFKAITINATTRPDIAKYKIEGNENLFKIGETSVNVLDNKSSVQVYFYGSDGNSFLGKTTLNVNTNVSDQLLQIQ